MIYMQPYEKPLYFLWVIVACLPIIIQLFRGKRMPIYQSLVTVFFLWVSFAGVNFHQGISLLVYVVFQILLTWGYHKYRQVANQTWVFCVAVIASIFPLFMAKISFLQQTHGTHGWHIWSFLGLSYLTFKAVQVIMETRDGLLKKYSVWMFIQFMLFFPTISSGPIDRYRRFEKDFKTAPTREAYVGMLDKGIQQIFLGFLYKYIIGYVLGSQLLPIIKDSLVSGPSFLMLLAYMYVYSMYLFFDFAGYSLFAVGVSHLMGFEVPRNFNLPFLSPNIKEFWNRWHMSLSFWFRDYVYMRLMFFLMKKKVFKSRIVASNIGYFALFLLMGLWHNPTWFYILYGLIHATFICVNDAWLRYKKKHGKNWPSNRWTHALAVFVTFHAVCFSFLVFSGILDTLLKLA